MPLQEVNSRTLAHSFAAQTRAVFERDGYAATMTIIVPPLAHGDALHAVLFTPEKTKEQFAAEVRKVVKKLDAAFTIQVGEMYLQHAQSAQEAAQIIDRGVKNTPGRLEAVMVVVQSKDGDSCSLVAEIIRERPGDEKSHGTLAEWVESPSGTELSGLFANPWGD